MSKYQAMKGKICDRLSSTYSCKYIRSVYKVIVNGIKKEDSIVDTNSNEFPQLNFLELRSM